MKNCVNQFILLGLLTLSLSTYSQNVGINATGAAPDAGALLDVSSTTKGLLIPRVNISNLSTIAPITGSSTTSMLVYNTNGTTGTGFYYWNGSQWVRFLENGDAWNITGNSNTTSGTHFLGTTNGQAVDFRSNNTIRFRIPVANQVHAMSLGTTVLPFYSFDADPNTGMWSSTADALNFSTGGSERFEMSATEAVFNDISADVNFRIESNGEPDMFFIDANLDNIGINTLTPGNMLHFESDGRAGWVTLWNNTSANGGLKMIYNNSTTNGSRVLMGVTNYSASALASAAVMGLSLNGTSIGSGGIGVQGSANNESGVAVYGTLAFSGGYTGWAGYFNADVYCGGTYFGSDRRLKKDIKSYTGALQIIDQINPVTYYYDTEKYPGIGFDEGRLQYGFIAQEIEQIIPEMVKDKNLVLNSNQLKTVDMQEERKTDIFKVVNYSVMIPILTQAVKEQQSIIESQNSKLEQLEVLIKELQEKVNK